MSETVPLRSSLAARKRNAQSLTAITDDPFHNDSPWTCYEVFKAVFLGLTLFPVRLVILVLALLVQMLIASLVSCGFPFQDDRGCLYHTRRMSSCRRRLLSPIVLTNRIVLWCLGFCWISITDLRTADGRTQKPKILVGAPHSNFADAAIMAYAFPIFPSAVGKKAVLNMPAFVGLCKACQNIMVDRSSAASREACKDAIALRAGSEWNGPPLMLFPEGTCTNASVLIQFKAGAFAPGKPVLPVILTYPYKYFNITWVDHNANTLVLAFRMMTQFINFCDIRILDTYVPSEAECSDAKLFASGVRAAMADSMGVSTTEHSYDDAFLSFIGNKAKAGNDFLVRELREKYKFEFDDLKVLLQRFKKFDKDGSGRIDFKTFSNVVGANDRDRTTQSLDRLFAFFDTDDTGYISYREFVQYASLLNGKCTSASRAKLAFLLYDTKGVGKISCGTLCTALDEASLYEAPPPQVVGARLDRKTVPTSTLSPGEELMKTLGKQKDEDVTFAEFEKLIERRPDVLVVGLQIARERFGIPDLGGPELTE